MSEIYIFNQDDELLTILTEETGLISAPFRDEKNSVASEPFVITVDADVERAKHVKEENRVVFKDKDGFWREMVIKELDDIDNNDGPQTAATCLPAWLDELSEHYVLDKRYTDKEAQLALNDALAGTRYIGEVEVSLGLASTNFYRLSSVDCIWKIISVWGGEFKDTVEFTGNKITTRKIILKQRLGADKGARFEIDHNIEEIQRTVLSYPKTAMHGWGASLETEGGGHTRYIDFGDVVWSKAKGDPVDKPKGQTWVGDPDALLKYGRKHEGQLLHRFAEFSNQDYEDPEELLWATWNNLQENREPVVNYKLSVDLLDKDVSLGDGAVAIDRQFARPIEIQTRVIAIEYDLLDIEGTAVVEMGQFLNLGDDDIYRDIEDLKNEVTKPRPTKPITDTSFPDIVPGIPVNIEAIGGFQAIQLYWNYDSEVYISHYEVYGSQVADFVPDSQHLLWRGRVSTFVHTVDTDQTWYYYLRAVNTRGTASSFSQRVSASAHRVMSDDILFGEIIADHLANNLDIADKLAQNTIDRINAGPMQEIVYTQQEIEATEERLLNQLNSEIGDVNASIGSLNAVADNLKTRADDTDLLLLQHGGKFTSIETEINDIEGRLSASITSVERIDDTVNSQSVTLLAQADLINAKLDSLTYQTDKAGIIDSIEANATELSLLATGLELRVTKEEFDALEIGGRNLLRNSDTFTGWQILAASLGEVANSSANPSYSYNSAEFTTSIASGVGISSPFTPVNTGLQYTAQAFIQRTQGNTDSFILSVLAYDKNKTILKEQVLTLDNSVVGASKGSYVESYSGLLVYGDNISNLLWGVFTVTDSRVAYVRVRAGVYRGTFTTRVNVSDVMLSKGNKTAGWTPAPEDTNAEIDAVRDRVSTTETTLIAHAGQILAKAEKTEVYTKSEINTSLGSKVDTTVYNKKVGELDVSISGIAGRVSNAETNVNALTGEVSSALSQIAAVDIKANGITQSVSEIRTGLTNIENSVGNLVNNPAVTGNTLGWSTSGVLTTVQQNFQGVSATVLQSSSAANAIHYSNWFNVDPAKSYEVTFWFKKSSSDGRAYLGLQAGTGDDLNTVGFDRVNTLGSVTNSDDRNFYFWYPANGSSPTDWVKVTGYIMPSGTIPQSMSGLGVFPAGTASNAIMKPNTKQIRVRWLNYDNVGTRQVWVANPKVVEIASDTVGRITSAEGSISTLAGEVALKATQTSVNGLTQRMSTAETTLNLLPGQLNAKVSKNGVISEINATPELIRIASKLIHLSGTSQIDDAIIGTAAMANLSVTNAKLGLLSVGTAQMQNLAVTNAKIGNLAVDDAKIANISVNKLKAGTLDANIVKVFGGSSLDYTTIDGSFLESRGRYTRTWRGSSATHDIKLRFENGYLRARNDSENRSLYFTDYGISTQVDGINASGTLEFFSKINNTLGRGVTLTSEGVTTIEANGGAIYLDASTTINAKAPIYSPGFITSSTNAYIGSDSELRLVNKGYVDSSGGSPIYRDLRAQFIWADAISTNTGTNLYLGADSEVRATSRSGNNGGSPIYRDLRAANLYGSSFITTSVHAYVGTDDELRVVNKGLSNIYRNIRAAGVFSNAIDIHSGTHFYVRPTASGELRVTTTGTTGTYRPVRAREFITDTSARDNKKGIEIYAENTLDIWRNANVYTYHRLDDEDYVKKQLGLMIDELPIETHSEAGDSFAIYALTSYVAKGVKDLVSVTDRHEDRLDEKDLEIQYLKQKIKQLEEMVA